MSLIYACFISANFKTYKNHINQLFIGDLPYVLVGLILVINLPFTFND